MSIVTPGPFWSTHTHSKYSFNDALPSVEAIVVKAVELGYPAIGLTDHRNMSGSVELYRAARKAGIEPLPGIELDVMPDTEFSGRADALHMTLNAYNETGYRNLAYIATLSAKKFHFKPIVDFADLAQMAQDGRTAGLALGTGCFFGVLPQTLMRHGFMSGVQVVEALAGWFPRVYIELQNHGVESHKTGEFDVTDDELLAAVFDVAQYTGIQPIIGRDSHYLNAEDQLIHDGLKELVSFSDDPSDATFPGGGYFMTDTDGLRQYFEPKYLDAGLAGLTELAEKAYLRLPELEQFSVKVPKVVFDRDPQEVLEEKTIAALAASPHAGKKAYVDQLRDELEVIAGGGMADYMLLCDDICQFMRREHIGYHVRGSASGSLVLWLLKVSQLDPIRLGLKFERFLSMNRLKPPDVDFDIDKFRRHEVVGYMESKWAVRQVGSHMKYSLEEDEDEDGESKGSLRTRFFSTLNKRGIATKDWRRIPKADKDMLYKIADLKLFSGFGRHAAGFIVAPDEASMAELPLWWTASSKVFVTQYGKKSVELLGFTKLDLLGLRTRTAIDVMCELADVVWEDIPERDRRTFDMIARGEVTGVFQLDGYAMRSGCQQLRPRKIADIFAAQALFRPAPLKSGMTSAYLDRRRNMEEVPQRHPDIMRITKDTFGVLLYQEQVMDVMLTIGLDQLEMESMLDAVKASNEYTEGARAAIAALMPRIRELTADRGWTQVDINWLADGLAGYSDYSFNLAHAASYGTIAYRHAWMKVHHPVEYWTGMLQAYADAPKPKGRPKKIDVFMQQARKDGHIILPPHVNRSQANFSMERGMIRKGLLTVPGLGPVAAEELVSKAPYSSLTDLGERVLPRKVSGAKGLALKKKPEECGGVIAALEEIGALVELEE